MLNIEQQMLNFTELIGCSCMPVAGLLCLKTAKSGGKSELASSITIHNELLKRDPEIIRTLVRITGSCQLWPGAGPAIGLPAF